MTGEDAGVCKHPEKLLVVLSETSTTAVWCAGCGSLQVHHSDHIGPWREPRAMIFLRTFLDLDSCHGARRG